MGKFIAGVRAAALLAALGLAGCFGDNPATPAEPPVETGILAQRTLDSAQALVQNKKFAASLPYFERAIALDSNLSQAYFGYATAVSLHYGLDLAAILEDLEAASKGNADKFLDHPDSVLTRRLQAASRINRVLDALVNRDSLSTTAKPLTDGKVTFDNIALQFAVYKFVYFLSSVHDLDRNDTLDFRDRPYFNLRQGSLGILDSLAREMKFDTSLQARVNQKLLDLQNGLGDIEWLLSRMNALDTAGSQYGTKNLLDSAIAGMDEAMPFYQFGDRKDNDGDGCIDEEIVDSLDNDLDGFVDEDARVINGNGAGTGPADGVDNDHNGQKDAADAGENKLGGSTASKQVLVFVALSGQGENWVKIKKGSANMGTRIQIQKDSLSLPASALKPGYTAKLQSVKDQVGGCWRNY